MITCLVLVERGGDASLDIVSNDYTEATKSAFSRLIDSDAPDIDHYYKMALLTKKLLIFQIQIWN